jgi:hypothetical protein
MHGICYFSARYAALMNKGKDWLPRNKYNVSEWSDVSNCCLGVLAQLVLNLVCLSSKKCNLFSSWYGWKIANLGLNNNHSLYYLLCFFILSNRRLLKPLKANQLVRSLTIVHVNMQSYLKLLIIAAFFGRFSYIYIPLKGTQSTILWGYCGR